ncbi:MAG: methyltransferase domain-containing protein [Thermomicrobiales bacterium]|nr:methyltransferase domain-containing protein [Thermomicrobiales bacterium]
MSQVSSKSPQPLVTSGTASWQRSGTTAEHELLTEFLEEVATTETIQTVKSVSIARMRLQPGARVLDVGCGTGVIFDDLATAIGPTGTITGLDHSAEFLSTARERADGAGYGNIVSLADGDAHDLPFPDASFDAAHVERVLMHLSDPDRALRELHRVVRPGGWVVCAEPDLTGMRLDLTDAEGAARIVAGFCASIGNPSIGLELNRRMAEVGFVDRIVDALTYVERDYDADSAEFFAKAARTAVERGWLDETRAQRSLEAMQTAADDGYFTSYSSMFVVAGRVP